MLLQLFRFIIKKPHPNKMTEKKRYERESMRMIPNDHSERLSLHFIIE